MKYTKYFVLISIQIIILFVIAFFGSMFADYLIKINAFGDIIHPISDSTHGLNLHENVEWGSRHYWFNWGVAILFSLQILRIIVFAVEDYRKYNQ